MRRRVRVSAKFVGFHGTPALKRDLWRIAKTEDRSLSQTVCALLRLGIARYFDLTKDTIEVARLKAKTSALNGGDSPVTDGERSERWKPSGVAERRAYAAQIDDALDFGKREFADRSKQGSTT